MAKQDLMISTLQYLQFPVHRDAELLRKIIEHPHIVIAGKKMNGDARIGDLRHLSQDTRIAFGHHRPVFIPKIEEVSDNEDFRGILPDLFEESDDVPFANKTGRMIGSAQMKIIKEIDWQHR